MKQSIRYWAVPVCLASSSVLCALLTVSPARLPELWRHAASAATLALPMTAIIVTGGIDLSVGSIVNLTGIIVGLAHQKAGMPIEWACVVGLLVGLAAGSINGLLVVARIAPLVATLATMALFSGLAMALTGGERIASLPPSFTGWGESTLAWIPLQVWVLAGTAFLMHVLVSHTWMGRALFAMGENRTAAEFAALPTRRLEFLLYALSGLIAGLVGVLDTALRAAAIPDAARGFELQAIACVVLGGTRVTGGFGSIPRTLIGIATLIHLQIFLRNINYQRLTLPFLGWPVRVDANAELIAIGTLVVLVAVINERLSGSRRDV